MTAQPDDPRAAETAWYHAQVRACQRGDSRALERIAERLTPQLYRFCRSLTRDEDAAMDLTHETLLAMVEALPRYRPRAPFTAWVYRIACNRWSNQISRRHPVAELADGAVETGDSVRGVLLADPAPPVEDHLTATQRDAAVRNAFLSLPEPLRAVLHLRYYEQRSLKETADILGISVSLAGVRAFRGLRMLRDLLQTEGASVEPYAER